MRESDAPEIDATALIRDATAIEARDVIDVRTPGSDRYDRFGVRVN